MSFTSAVDHLHALGLELAPSPDTPRRKFDLEHMRILARALGDPQTRFPAVLIAGTNGKGSTAATLSSILAAAGFRTGLYTSPHLTRVTERIRITAPAHPVILSETLPTPTHPVILSETLPTPAHPVILSETLPTPTHPVILSEGALAPQSKDPDSSRPSTTSRTVLPQSATFTEIPEDDFARLYFHIDEVATRLVSTGELPHHPSFFETLTALAFLFFAGHKADGTFADPVDIAILEVGLGGRLDATNIVEPILSVITDIALDHQEYLGNTIAEIAREKAGILRPNGILITLPQLPAANQAIGEVAVALNVRGINAAAYLPDRNAFPTASHAAEQFAAVAFRSSSGLQPAVNQPQEKGALAPGLATPLPANNYDITVNGERIRVRSPLAGEHQRRNIALAIAAAIELRNQIGNKSSAANPIRNQTSSESPNLEPNTANIERGIAQTAWPGRLEFLPPNLLLDVAHNPAGAWTLRAAIASLPDDRPRTLIFSCLRDKDLREMAQILFPLFDSSTPQRSTAPSNLAPRTSNLAPQTSHPAPQTSSLFNLILTPINNPRAASLEGLLDAARALDIPAHPAESPREALALARQLTPDGGLILATGSIYLIGTLRDLAS